MLDTTFHRQIKEKILSGEYRAGDKLPSKRVTADKSGFSIITVEQAYAMLIDEGYIHARQRSGYFVCKPELFPGNAKSVKKPVFPLLDESVPPPHGDFEYSLWFKTVRKVISEKSDQLFAKSPGKGCAVLRNAIAEYLLRYRNMVAPPERIIVGSGAEQLYETVVKILGRDKVYGIEHPSYSQIEAVYSGEGVKIKKLAMGSDGIEENALKHTSLDVLHVTPFRSYPTNITTSAQKRREYLKWAKSGRYAP